MILLSEGITLLKLHPRAVQAINAANAVYYARGVQHTRVDEANVLARYATPDTRISCLVRVSLDDLPAGTAQDVATEILMQLPDSYAATVEDSCICITYSSH